MEGIHHFVCDPMSAEYDSIACDDYHANTGGNGEDPSFCDPMSAEYDSIACDDYHANSGGNGEEPSFCDPITKQNMTP